MSVLRVMYVLAHYPKLTTTFIDREIVALRKMGVQIQILSLFSPKTILSREQKEIQKDVVYLSPIRWKSFLSAHLHFALRRPRRYIGTLVYLLTRPHETLLSRRVTLRQFIQGICAAHLIKGAQVDHIHMHFIHSAMVAMVIHRILDLPYSVTAHPSGDVFVRPFLLHEKFADAKFVATCTHYNEVFLKELGKGDFADKIKCIYHGLDVQRYRQNGYHKNGRPVILGVGSLKERKGYHVLVEACHILQERGFEFECRIVGEGPEQACLENQIQQLGLVGKVKLVGPLPQEDVIRQYEQSTVFTLPTVVAEDGDRDGIPNVILEAMSMELPVISTRNSAVPEVIEDEVNGLLVPPGDPIALSDALICLLERPGLRELYGLRGRMTVIEKFNPEKNAQRLLEEIVA